jgi:hypothetical protein
VATVTAHGTAAPVGSARHERQKLLEHVVGTGHLV